MSKNFQKIGGLAALYEAAAYLFGIVGYLVIVDVLAATSPAQQVAMLAGNEVFLGILNLLTYIVFGLVLVVLVLALYERLKPTARGLAQVAAGVGLIWAAAVIASGMIANFGMRTVVDLYSREPDQAAAAWLAINVVAEGLGSQGGEILGGTWVLLISYAALRGGGLPRVLNYLGTLIGFAGVLSAIPVLGELGLGMVFGLGQIPWFVWLGVAMWRRLPDKASRRARSTRKAGRSMG